MKKEHMTRAKFVGSPTASSYKTPEFNAMPGNMVSMPDARWTEITAKGDVALFTGVTKVDGEFPQQNTVGPRRV